MFIVFAAIIAVSTAISSRFPAPELPNVENAGIHDSTKEDAILPTTTASIPIRDTFVCEHYRMGISWPSEVDRSVYLKCDFMSGSPTVMRCPTGTFFEFQRQRCVLQV